MQSTLTETHRHGIWSAVVLFYYQTRFWKRSSKYKGHEIRTPLCMQKSQIASAINSSDALHPTALIRSQPKHAHHWQECTTWTLPASWDGLKFDHVSHQLWGISNHATWPSQWNTKWWNSLFDSHFFNIVVGLDDSCCKYNMIDYLAKVSPP